MQDNTFGTAIEELRLKFFKIRCLPGRFCTINEMILGEAHINAGFRKLEREPHGQSWVKRPGGVAPRAGH